MAVMPRKFGAECNANQMIIAQIGLPLARTIRRESEKEPLGESFGSYETIVSISFEGKFVIYSDVFIIASAQEAMDATPTKVLSYGLLASCRGESLGR